MSANAANNSSGDINAQMIENVSNDKDLLQTRFLLGRIQDLETMMMQKNIQIENTLREKWHVDLQLEQMKIELKLKEKQISELQVQGQIHKVIIENLAQNKVPENIFVSIQEKMMEITQGVPVPSSAATNPPTAFNSHEYDNNNITNSNTGPQKTIEVSTFNENIPINSKKPPNIIKIPGPCPVLPRIQAVLDPEPENGESESENEEIEEEGSQEMKVIVLKSTNKEKETKNSDPENSFVPKIESKPPQIITKKPKKSQKKEKELPEKSIQKQNLTQKQTNSPNQSKIQKPEKIEETDINSKAENDTITQQQPSPLHNSTKRIANVESKAKFLKSLFSNNKRIITTHNSTVKIWKGNELVSQFQGHDKLITSTAVGEGDIFTSSWDGTVKSWSIEKNPLQKYSVLPTKKSFQHDFKLVTGLSSGQIQIWNTMTERIVTEFSHDSGSSISSLTGAGDASSYLFSSDSDGKIKVWDVAPGKLCTEFLAHSAGPVTSLFYEQATKILYSCGGDKKIRGWDVRMKNHNKPVKCSKAHSRSIASLFSLGGYLYTGDNAGVVRKWDFSALNLLSKIKLSSFPSTDKSSGPNKPSGNSSMVWLDGFEDNGVLCTGLSNGNVAFYDVSAGGCDNLYDFDTGSSNSGPLKHVVCVSLK